MCVSLMNFIQYFRKTKQGRTKQKSFELMFLLQNHKREIKKEIESVHFSFLYFSSSLDGVSSFSIRFHLYFDTSSCDHQP
jgi:hypothetical protein